MATDNEQLLFRPGNTNPRQSRQLLAEYQGNSPFKYKILGNLLAVLLLKIKEMFWKDYDPREEGTHSSPIVITFKKNADLDAQYNTNFKSVFFLTQALVGDLRDGGRIINLGSGTTHTAFLPLIAYATIKGAVELLTQYLAKALGERLITVNTVAPGALDTDFNKDLFSEMPGARDYIASITALGRVGVADDAAGVIAFLCINEARWITGQRLEVSGGAYL